ncbi:MAG: hypothetical protein GX416_11910 [Bacteroidales bacterium]|nr:hypothetical protein [Bacteroidales bacterium]
MKEENELLKLVGKENPFKVPEDYFDDFTTLLMDKLPEAPEAIENMPVTKWVKIKPYVYMAAMFIGAVLMVKAIHLVEGDQSAKSQKSGVSTELTQDKYIDETVDASRLDGYQLYTFLSDANEESAK